MTRPSEIARFVEAQADGEHEAALAEITAGRKRGHWIWYTFPQIAGLGTSHMSQAYAIHDRGGGGGVPLPPAAVAAPARDRQRRGESPEKGRGAEHLDGIVDRRREAGVVDDALRRGRAHAAGAVRGRRRRTRWRTRRKRFSLPQSRRAMRAASNHSECATCDVLRCDVNVKTCHVARRTSHVIARGTSHVARRTWHVAAVC